MAISPASVTTGTGSIAHKATVYYDRVAMDNLKKALRFFSLVEPRRLPRQSGLVSQMFRYIPFAANTTGGTEGTVGTGIAITTETVSVTVVQYFDLTLVNRVRSHKWTICWNLLKPTFLSMEQYVGCAV